MMIKSMIIIVIAEYILKHSALLHFFNIYSDEYIKDLDIPTLKRAPQSDTLQ